MALLLASEEENRRQADVLRQQGAELDLLRSGGRAPSPLAAASPRGSVADDAVALLAAKVDEQQRLIQQLLHMQQHPPPAAVPQPAVAPKNESKKTGQELRRDPHFQQMSLGADSSALDVAHVVHKMFALFGAAGATLQQLLLWVLQLPASETSQVPAVLTDAVRTFCADQLGFPLGSGGGGVSDGEGSDCFGIGEDSARRRGVFQRLLGHLQQLGPDKDLDAELLISFKERLLPSLRLSDDALALPTFAALLAKVLCFLEHGPSSILASVVGAFFSYVPCPARGTANQLLRGMREDLVARLQWKRHLDLTPYLLPVALTTSVISTAAGSAGVIVSAAVSELLGRAADPGTTADQLLQVLDRASQTSGHNGTVVVDWVPPAASTYSQLLTQRPQVLPGSSASPAAASLLPAKPAPSKSAPSKHPPRPAAKAQPQGGQPAVCPLGAACPTAGNLYNYCKLPHSDVDWAAIRARRQQQNVPCFGKKSRHALLLEIAAGGGPSGGGGGGGGQPRASPSAAAAPTPQPVPPPVPQPAPTPAVSPSQPVPSAALAAASEERMAALQQFLGSMGTPGFAALGVPGVAAPPSMANIPAAVAPMALAAAAPAPAGGPADAPVWGGPKCLLCVDSGSKHPYAPNTAGAPTRRVPGEKCVTSSGELSETNREFAATVHLRDVKGRYYRVVLGNIREQPGLVLPPSAPGGRVEPVMLVDLDSIAGSGGVIHAEGQWASDGPSEKATVRGYVRLRVHDGCDPRVEPRGRLSDKIDGVFTRGVFELPTVALPAGTEPVPVFLGRPSAALSASSVALAAPERDFGNLLRFCRVWHSGVASLVPVFAASSPAEQAAYIASNGGLDPAAQLRLGMSLFSSCLDDLASAFLRDVGVSVPSCSAVSGGLPVATGAAVYSALPSRAVLAAGSLGVQPAPSALVALLAMVRRSSTVVPSSGAVPLAAPPASSSSSSSLLSPQ